MAKKKRTKEPKKKTEEELLEIAEIPTEWVRVEIIGITDLVTHRFSERSLEYLRAKRQGQQTTGQKKKRNPEQEAREAMYLFPGEEENPNICAMKAIAFKRAMEEAGTPASDWSKAKVRRSIFVHGDVGGYVRIEHDGYEVIEDVVRLSGQGRPPDLRYRPHFKNWRCAITIEFTTEEEITLERVIYLLGVAAWGIGIGEKTPRQSGGEFGRFQIGRVESLPGHLRSTPLAEVRSSRRSERKRSAKPSQAS